MRRRASSEERVSPMITLWLWTHWKQIAICLGAVVLAAATFGIVSHFKDAAYQKRETQREAERAQLETEKTTLQAEKQKALTDATEAKAAADVYKQVAETKRTDRAETVKELNQVEVDHAKHKAEAESAGSSLSDDELRRELCTRLAARGYPACPN